MAREGPVNTLIDAKAEQHQECADLLFGELGVLAAPLGGVERLIERLTQRAGGP